MAEERAHATIGEVLGQLKEDFPDVTVSKIRFLESEGLIAPERTAAGYRKFSNGDIERLRAILALQRDAYLPLKVIRERLDAFDAGDPTALDVTPAEQGTLDVQATPGATMADAGPAQAAPVAPVRPQPRPENPMEEFAAPMTAMHLTEGDLAGAAGLKVEQIQSLREFGVLCEHSMNGGTYFDEDDLVVAKIARDFMKHGIEPRHLKMFRQFAEREAGLFEQLMLPALRNRSPEARKQATRSLAELASLTVKIRRAFLRQTLRSHLSGDSDA